jgi:hypothetical protein
MRWSISTNLWIRKDYPYFYFNIGINNYPYFHPWTWISTKSESQNQAVKKGDGVGINVPEKVREGDAVCKIIAD